MFDKIIELSSNWVWWVSQGFAVIGLIFIIVSMQQKSRISILSWNLAAAVSMFISCCCMWQFSAMILMGVSSVRSVTALIFAIKPDVKKWIFITTNVVLALLIVVLNIVFWNGYFSIFSIIIGIGFIISFAQVKPRNIRLTIAPIRVISTVYYLLMLATINAVIELTALISAIVGMIRLDFKKKPVTVD